MKCPFCQNNNIAVLESRSVERGKAIRRRRICEKCGKRFTTHEKVDKSLLWVVKKSGRREPFEREKIKRGIIRAVEKRPVTLEVVDEIVEQVEREMMRKQNPEVASRAVGASVTRRLKKVDKVAWLRFASVYLEFEDLEDFLEIIKNI
jgi:transcriptional repressor NrdR